MTERSAFFLPASAFCIQLSAFHAMSDALAQIYARSLFELASAAGGREKVMEVSDELEQLCDLARRERKFRDFLASPVVDRERRAKSLERILGNRVTDLTLRFLLVLNEKGRLDRLESVAAAVDHLVHEAFGRVEVDVFTPAPLGQAALDSVRQRVQAALGREPVLHTYTDPSMIGGIRLRIGDQLIDGSVSSQLRRLKGSLRASGGALREKLSRFIEDGGR
jgi:F-type H+-transporting ATPase subunit delta